MMAVIIWRKRPCEVRACTVSPEEAGQDVKNGLPEMWPWAWIGLLCAGLPIQTPTATYALSRVQAEQA